MDVSEIVKKYLVDNGFDGLCNGDNECGCGIDDLFECMDGGCNCEPAYKTKIEYPCDECGNPTCDKSEKPAEGCFFYSTQK